MNDALIGIISTILCILVPLLLVQLILWTDRE